MAYFSDDNIGQAIQIICFADKKLKKHLNTLLPKGIIKRLFYLFKKRIYADNVRFKFTFKNNYEITSVEPDEFYNGRILYFDRVLNRYDCIVEIMQFKFNDNILAAKQISQEYQIDKKIELGDKVYTYRALYPEIDYNKGGIVIAINKEYINVLS